jgi:3-phosphoshikimate 1-carboxyvinyltransferase
MACAAAALGAKGNTIIHDADAVKKSYPGFFDDLKKLKVNLQVS